MRVRASILALGLTVGALPTPVFADSFTMVSWLAVGSERIDREADFHPAVNSYGYSDSTTENNSAGAQAEVRFKDIWEGETAYSESDAMASVDQLTLRTRASVAGVIANTLNAVPSCDPTIVPCPVFWVPVGGVWHDYSFESLAFAQASDNVAFTAASATPASFRMTFDVEGTQKRFVDYPRPSAFGGNGGGYTIEEVLFDTTLSLSTGSSWTALYSATSDPEPEWPLNPIYDGTPLQLSSTVTTPRIGITGGGASFDLTLQTLARLATTNLDDGRLVFNLTNDFGNTVTLRGFEVFDANGALITDAVVTSESGFLYPLLGAAPPPASVPEPTTLVCVVTALLASARRLRRVSPASR